MDPEVEGGPTPDGRRIYVTKRMVSEFGTSVWLQGMFRHRTATHRIMSSEDHSQDGTGPLCSRSDSKKTRRRDWSLSGKPRTMCCGKRRRPKRPSAHARRRCGTTRIITSWSARSANDNDVQMAPTNSGKQTLKPDGDDDTVCWLEVCDKLNESTAYADDGDEDFTNDMTEATLVRDDVARARAEDRT